MNSDALGFNWQCMSSRPVEKARCLKPPIISVNAMG